MTRGQRQPRQEAVDERNLQLVSICDLDTKQVRILNVEAAANSRLGAANIEPIIRQLANAGDFAGEIFERFASWIEDANTRVGTQSSVGTSDCLDHTL